VTVEIRHGIAHFESGDTIPLSPEWWDDQHSVTSLCDYYGYDPGIVGELERAIDEAREEHDELEALNLLVGGPIGELAATMGARPEVATDWLVPGLLRLGGVTSSGGARRPQARARSPHTSLAHWSVARTRSSGRPARR